MERDEGVGPLVSGRDDQRPSDLSGGLVGVGEGFWRRVSTMFLYCCVGSFCQWLVASGAASHANQIF
jgi:hypothetical protein